MVKLKSLTSLSALTLIALNLNGCWNNDDDNKSDSPKLIGTAATGAPIVGGNVVIKCAEGDNLATITNESGKWEVAMSGQVFPCALAVSGGDLAENAAYHSLALAIGNVNITPLTDLIVANLLDQNPTEWFSALNVASLTTINQTVVDSAVNEIATNLGLTTALNNFNPFTVAFNAVTGDRIDNILQALGNVVQSVLTNYSELVTWAAYPSTFTLPATFATDFNTVFNTITNGESNGGTDNGGNTGNVTLLSCDTNLFQENTVHEATAAELQAFDGAYTGQIYTDDGSGNSTPSDATVGYLSTNGIVTIDNIAKVITSACVDNQISATGGTLYLNFADGHLDLFGDNTFSGSISSSATDGTDNGGNTGGDTGTGTDTGGTPSTNADLTVSVSVSGATPSNIEVKDVPEPTTESAFCGAVENDSTFTNIGNQGGGTLTLNSCSFSGRVGNISATLTITSPISMTLPYTVTYTYH